MHLITKYKTTWELLGRKKPSKKYVQILLKATMSQLWTYSLMGSTVRCSSIRLSTETRSSTIVSIICSFLMPYPTGTSLAKTRKKLISESQKRSRKYDFSLNQRLENNIYNINKYRKLNIIIQVI